MASRESAVQAAGRVYRALPDAETLGDYAVISNDANLVHTFVQQRIAADAEAASCLQCLLLSEQLDDVEDRFSKYRASSSATLKGLRIDVQRLGKENAQLRGDVQRLEKDNAQLRGDVQRLEKDNAQLRGDVQRLEKDNAQLRGDMQQMRADIDAIVQQAGAKERGKSALLLAADLLYWAQSINGVESVDGLAKHLDADTLRVARTLKGVRRSIAHPGLDDDWFGCSWEEVIDFYR